MSAPPPSGGFSLFPNTNTTKPPQVRMQTPRGRRSESRERTRAPTPGAASASDVPHAIDSPPRNGRQTPQSRMQSPVEHQQSPQNTHQSPLDGRQSSLGRREEHAVQPPRAAADIPPRSETAFSEAQTLVRSNSNRSRSSIAKLPLPDEPEASSSQGQPALRSIFPQYNPELPLTNQDYFPTQTSPTHIPRAVISRTTYHPDNETGRSTQVRSPARDPMSAGSAQPQRWPKKNLEPPVIPTTSSTEQLKSLWKVTNGWKASASEGRVYCMRLSQEKDAPVYTLSSTNQPFYNMRLDPTSASAYVTLTRHDPSKPYKAPGNNAGSSATSILGGVVGHSNSGKAAESKHWQEALTTTLEEESRRHPPNDGLVALLYPTAASKMALDKPDDMNAVMMAEMECARLVWDEDSANHFLVHPALATPFCITIERSPAWSRVEYTLEHHESPQHLAKLTRDGTGSGWLEVDTNIASKIESFFILDVAVTALLLVAAGDEKIAHVETFEPPPASLASPRQERRLSKMSKKDDKRRGKRGRMEEFEMDLESQHESFEKLKSPKGKKKDEDKLPGVLRVAFKIVGGLFKCLVWVLTISFKALAAIVKGLARCVGVK